MAKEKPKAYAEKKEGCTSVFKSGILTKEAYTSIWIELIAALERKSRVIFPPSQ